MPYMSFASEELGLFCTFVFTAKIAESAENM